MPVTKQVQLDLLTPGETPRIYAKQGETMARNIDLRLFAGGEPWIIPPQSSPVIRYSVHCLDGGENTTGIYDTMPDGGQAFQFQDNQFQFTAVSGMLARHGIVLVDVAFIHRTEVIATFNLEIYVAKAPALGTEPEVQSFYRVATLDQINDALDQTDASVEQVSTALTGHDARLRYLEQSLHDAYDQLEDLYNRLQVLESQS